MDAKEEISKQVLTSKLKAIHLKYRQAIDSGRRSGHGRSGHGRVVMLYFELCKKVWGDHQPQNKCQVVWRVLTLG